MMQHKYITLNVWDMFSGVAKVGPGRAIDSIVPVAILSMVGPRRRPYQLEPYRPAFSLTGATQQPV